MYLVLINFSKTKLMKHRLLKWQIIPFLIMAIILFASNVQAQEINVRGKIIGGDDKGPLVGVSVVVEGTTIGIVSNMDGDYYIKAPSPNSTLVFSFIGYQVQKVKIGNRTTINVELIPDIQRVDEVVVVGYRTVARGTITGSVSSVSSSEFQDVPADNLSNALAGRLSGVVLLIEMIKTGMDNPRLLSANSMCCISTSLMHL